MNHNISKDQIEELTENMKRFSIKEAHDVSMQSISHRSVKSITGFFMTGETPYKKDSTILSRNSQDFINNMMGDNNPYMNIFGSFKGDRHSLNRESWFEMRSNKTLEK